MAITNCTILQTRVLVQTHILRRGREHGRGNRRRGSYGATATYAKVWEFMKVSWTELDIPGLFISSGANFEDSRGSFRKIVGASDDRWPAPFDLTELYWSRSILGTVRGFHLQLPPKATRKIVFVTHGAIRDFVIDLRVGSPTERQLFEILLTPHTGGLLVPQGLAHAYEVIEDNSIVCYAQDESYDEENYAGIRFNSVGISLKTEHPTLTQRDLEFPALNNFVSPFEFAP